MFLPLMLDLQDVLVIIVGGGQIALRKAGLCLEHGANLRLISPEFCPELKQLAAESDSLELLGVKFAPDLLEPGALVIAATDSAQVNLEVVEASRKLGLWVNNAGSKTGSTFINPAVYTNGGLTLAISTGGQFPFLSKRIRQDFATRYVKYDREYLDLLGRLRYRLLELYPDNFRQVMADLLDLSLEDLREFAANLADPQA